MGEPEEGLVVGVFLVLPAVPNSERFWTRCFSIFQPAFIYGTARIVRQFLLCICILLMSQPSFAKEDEVARIEHAFQLMKEGRDQEALLEANLVPLSSCNIQQKLLRFEVLAESKYQLQRFRDSLRDFDQLIQTREKLIGTLGKSDPSIDAEKRLLSMSYTHKGKALFRLGKLEDSLACANNALKVQPNNPSALSDRAKLLVKLHRPGEALRDINEVLKKLNHDVTASKSVGRTYGSRAALIEFLYLRAEASSMLGRSKDAQLDRAKADLLTHEL